MTVHRSADLLGPELDGIDEVTVLDAPLAQARGVIGRYPEPGEAYVFPFDEIDSRGVHMIGVRRPLRVRWLVDGELVADESLRPWLGRGSHRADMVVESRPATMSDVPDECPECGSTAIHDANKELSGDPMADWYCTDCGASDDLV